MKNLQFTYKENTKLNVILGWHGDDRILNYSCEILKETPKRYKIKVMWQGIATDKKTFTKTEIKTVGWNSLYQIQRELQEFSIISTEIINN